MAISSPSSYKSLISTYLTFTILSYSLPSNLRVVSFTISSFDKLTLIEPTNAVSSFHIFSTFHYNSISFPLHCFKNWITPLLLEFFHIHFFYLTSCKSLGYTLIILPIIWLLLVSNIILLTHISFFNFFHLLNITSFSTLPKIFHLLSPIISWYTIMYFGRWRNCRITNQYPLYILQQI